MGDGDIMKKYLIIIQKSLKSESAYHSAAITGMTSSLLTYLIQIFLWHALLGAGTQNHTNFSEMLIYVLVNTVMIELTKGNVANMIEASMIDGSISVELLRPISYKLFTLANLFGKNVYNAVIRALPIITISFFLIQFNSLPDLTHLALFIMSASLGSMLMFEITYFVGLFAFWIQRCWFLSWYLSGFLIFFGGTKIPIWFYPKSLAQLSYLLPFRYITFEPINFFLCKTTVEDAFWPLFIAIFWLALLCIFDRFVWRFALKKLCINGG